MAGSSAQLARVTDRSPLLVALRTSSNNGSSKTSTHVAIVVKIRPNLLHFLVDGCVWCIIRSKVPIADVRDYHCNESEAGETRLKLLVAVADGNVWIVTLPGQFQPEVGEMTSELVLERSFNSGSDGGCVQWFCQVPGVQSTEHVPAGSGLSSLTLLRSLVTPTMLIVSTLGKSESTLQRHQSLELDEIEGEQSTCTFCLNSRDLSHSEMLKKLFPEVMNYAGMTAVLQGDLDGCVRFSLVQYPCVKGDIAKASVIRSGILLQLDQPVQMIVPFSSSVSPTLLPGNNEAVPSSLVFNTLLVLGTRGQLGIVDLERGSPAETLPVSVKRLEIGRAVQSLTFLNSLAVCIYCSSGSAFVCRSTDLLAKAQHAHAEANGTLNDGTRVCGGKLPLQPGIVRLTTHAQGISILFASGRITAINEAALHEMETAMLPLQRHPGNHVYPGLAGGEPLRESCVRNLLQQIAQISDASATLRTQSQLMDHQLDTLHSALKMLRLVDTAGVDSVIKCELSASMIETRTFSGQQTVKLVCSLRFVNPESVISPSNWWLCFYVRINQRAVTTYSFPMKDVFVREEQSVILNPDTVAAQDQGSLWVSCSLVFCPPESGQRKTKRNNTSTLDLKTAQRNSPLSFAIPLLQSRRFVLAQLSRPIEGDIPVSQVAINAAFRQNQDPFMPVNRADSSSKTDKASSSALWGGVQWWAALADYAQSNPSFAALWSKVAPPEVTTLALSPPSRFVISISSFFTGEGDDEDGSLILLRFTPSEDQSHSVDLTIQCSDVADLSAMRALVLEAISKWSDGTSRTVNEEDRSQELALDIGEMLEPIAALESLLEDLAQKTIKSIEDPQSSVCTDEVLQALSQLAHLETQTLTLYWKTRMRLNRTIM
ncbi:hypothetical protein PRIC1_009417 [Phytophthora ramorum]